MKLFLDIASQFLAEKRNYYNKRAKSLGAASLIMCFSAFIIAYILFFLQFMWAAFLAAAVFLFLAALTAVLARENSTKSGVYSQIFEDLQEVRARANERSELMAK